MTRVCTSCGEEKAKQEFSFRNKGRGILQNKCKTCHRKYLRDNYDPEKKRRVDLKNKYNLTEKSWGDLYLKQGGRCAICKEGSHKLYVDHCHKTGIVRGLLCNRCNLGIGQFNDDIDALRSAARYLETFVKEGI